MLCKGLRVLGQEANLSEPSRSARSHVDEIHLASNPSSGLEFAAHSRGAESVAKEVAAGLVAPPQTAPEQKFTIAGRATQTSITATFCIDLS